MADDIDQGFNYQPGRSTSNIFYHDDNGFPRSCNLNLPWRPAWIPAPIPIPIPIYGPITVCSSSSGFIIFRVDYFSEYYIGNPFLQHQPRYRGPLAPPPAYHPRHDTNVVLAVDRLPGVMLPIFHVICASRRYPSIYDFHTFSSTTGEWASHPGINLRQREIVPNTGVSCGRFAFWLTKNPRSVLRYDVARNSEMISFLDLPQVIPPAGRVRMQLGRTGDSLGLVIVSEAASTVELYTRPLAVAENVWGRVVVFYVEIEANANMACRLREGSTLVCREMPRPMRFESFNIELLLWVSGEVVMLESSTTQWNFYRQWVLPVNVIDGLPHVRNHLLPLAFG